jgi:hypothetical protein
MVAIPNTWNHGWGAETKPQTGKMGVFHFSRGPKVDYKPFSWPFDNLNFSFPYK